MTLSTLVETGRRLFAQGKFAEAEPLLVEAHRLMPMDPALLNKLGLCRIQLGQAAGAVEEFQKLIALYPEAAQPYHNLGLALRLQNRSDDALSAFARAVELDPLHESNFLQLFKQYQQMTRWSEAIAALEAGLARHPGSLLLSEALAIALGRMGKSERAQEIFERISEHDASGARAYGEWLQQQGRFDEAMFALRRSIQLQPKQGVAYRLLAESRSFEIDGTPLTDSVQQLLADTSVDERSRMHLFYALGKSLDASGAFEDAMHAFDSANALAYKAYPSCRTFDVKTYERELEELSKIYHRPKPNVPTASPHAPEPILIVGMIRSGTTLLDQIVSAHPAVAPAGEQPFWNSEADRIQHGWREGPEPSQLQSLAQRYREILASESEGEPFVTDKMPLNFRHLGLIHWALPEAKILHIRRDAVDTCLSIYMTYFGGGPSFTYSKQNIVAFYKLYERYIELWRSLLPATALLEIDYESLVTDREATTRKVIDFLGLAWDDLCLDPSANASKVATPSRWQVRQPVYATSVARWKRYEKSLGPFGELAKR